MKNETSNKNSISSVLPLNSSIQMNSDSESIQNEKIVLHDLSSKDKELIIIKKKAAQLERDKQNLLMEMQNLLESASTDNEKLKAELDSRSEKLSKLNSDLEQSKQEQADLLDETNALYHQADVSLTVLKTMLKEREYKLMCMSGSLEQAKTNQEKLVKERDECVLLAKEKEDMYKSLLAANSSQVQAVQGMLDSTQKEKQRLEKGVSDLREKLAKAKDEQDRHLTDSVARLQSELAEKEKVQAEMKEKVRRREEKLQKARREMEKVTKYLRTMTDKELEARSKLEVFISGLIDRAGRAEAELRQLKSHQLAGPSMAYSRHDDVEPSTNPPSVNYKTFLPDNDSTPRERRVDKATGKLDYQHHHSQENLLHSQRIPKGSTKFPTKASNSQHPDKMSNDKHRSPISVENNNSSPSRYNSGEHRYRNQQNPDVAIRYRQGLNSGTTLHPSNVYDTSHLSFENTPEVERMFHNVNRQTYIHPSDPLQSRIMRNPDGGRVKRHMANNSEQDSLELHIDDNGIMWEQTSPYYLNDTNVQLNNKYGPMLNESVVYQRLNDDTDVDEDFTDYVHEKEPVSFEETRKTKNFLATSTKKITNARGTSHQKDYIPFDEKFVKNSSHPEPENRQTNKNYIYSHNLQQSKPHFDSTQNSNSQGMQLDQMRMANDYSATESSGSSPLHKARAVQRRVEQLTSYSSCLPRTNSSSKQSGGFEISHLDRESDFSSSSYASLAHPQKPLNTKELYAKEKGSHGSAAKESYHSPQTNPTFDENKPHTEMHNKSAVNDSIHSPQSSTLNENKPHTEMNHKSAVNDPIQSPQTNSALNENKQHNEMCHDIKDQYPSPQTNTALVENKDTPKENPHVDFESIRPENASGISNEPSQGYEGFPTSTNVNNSEHPRTDLPVAAPRTKQSNVLSSQNVDETLPNDSPQESNKANLNSPADSVIAKDTSSAILEKEELLQRHKEDELLQRNKEDELLQRHKEDELLQRHKEDELLQRHKEDELLQRHKENELLQRHKEDELLQRHKEDELLQRHKEDELLLEKETKVGINGQSETQTTSEDELLDEDDDDVSPQMQSLHKMSVDASTDTDLEKLAMPGQLQKGFVVKKNMPNKKRIIRKKTRPKPKLKKSLSQESLSSETDDLADEEKQKRLAIRKMRVVLFRVFYYLDTRTLLTVACVSKDWCRVSRHPALWRHVLLENNLISSEFLITLSKWCTQTKSLSLKGLRGRQIVGEDHSEEASRGSLEQGLEAFLSTCHNTITEIHITGCETILTDKCLWLVSGYCRLLTALTYLSSKDPITPQLMWALGGGCPGITRLFVHPQHPCEKTGAMNNRCLLLIAQLYPDIEELGLGGKEFDRAGLLPLITSCQRLKNLHLDHCLVVKADLTSALCKAGLKHLHTLTISSTYVEAKAIQNIKDSCRQLKRIHVSVNIQDCVDNPSKAKDKETYKKMVKALEALKAKSGFGIIFTLEALPEQ